MARTTVSLVCYRHDPVALEALWDSLAFDEAILCWIAIDNSTHEDAARAQQLRASVERCGGRYLAAPRNLGFGGGHNLALQALADIPSEFHLILNLDIAFDASALSELAHLMDARPQVGLTMPRVFYPDGKDQRLCKLLPSPLDFVLRRFTPGWLQRTLCERMDRYELQVLDPTQPAEIPFLSGCFMFTRRTVLEAIGGFDERYFLYMEDVDLCRRLALVSTLLYWPEVSVVHGHERGSHKHWRLMLLHVRSAMIYFNRWGWFIDGERTRANRSALAQRSVVHATQK